jgi:hypothetical protein
MSMRTFEINRGVRPFFCLVESGSEFFYFFAEVSLFFCINKFRDDFNKQNRKTKKWGLDYPVFQTKC